MIKISFWFFCIALVSNVCAQTINTKCSLNGLSILYLNGVNSTPDSGVGAIKEATASLRAKLDEGNVRYEKLTNPKQGILDDVVEFTIQKEREKARKSSTTLEEDLLAAELVLTNVESQAQKSSVVLGAVFSFFDFKSVLKKYKETFNNLVWDIRSRLQRNEKVLIVAHSQGNMFMNEIRTKLLNDSDLQIREKAQFYLRDYAVGSPAKASIHNSLLPAFKLSEDIATGGFGDSGQFSKLDSGDKKNSDLLNHGFIETYMNSSLVVVNKGSGEQSYARNIVINDIIQIAQSFPPNCCHNGSSKNGNGSFRPSQGNSNFVSFYSTVDNSVGLSDGAEVCGGEVRGKVIIRGNVHIYGSPRIYGTSPSDFEKIEINGAADSPLVIRDNVRISGEKITIANLAGAKSLILKDSIDIQGCQSSLSQSSLASEMVVENQSKFLGHFSVIDTSVSANSLIEGDTTYPCSRGSSIVNSTIKGTTVRNGSLFNSMSDDSKITGASIMQSSVEGSSVSNGSGVSFSSVRNGSSISNSQVSSCVVDASTLSSVLFSSTYLYRCTCDGKNDGEEGDPCYECLHP